ncbi:hypothetical protein [Planctomycetes bacterium K23_9]|uniref:Transmembrane protein n=1 Tax=Stieleria marina TaxID=1930275 RepID=A0A517P0S0_9BACT|nr:hypothetical protein K239x_49840 [Planctomycetes bacterium K23_9]
MDQNPYAVTTADPSRDNSQFALPPRTVRAKVCLFLVAAAIPLMLLGTTLAFFDIESIIGSGPVMLVYGCVLFYVTLPAGLPRFRWFAWVCLVFPAAIFMLIFLLSWSPQEAQQPVSITIAVMTLFALAGLAGSLMAHQTEKSEMAFVDSLQDIDQLRDADAASEQDKPPVPSELPVGPAVDPDNPLLAKPLVASDQPWKF